MASRSRAIYIGITSNLERRVDEHKKHLIEGFTKKYKCTRLVCLEETHDVNAAIAREKEIKGWTRQKKIKLIEEVNPTWQDLSEDWFE